MHLSIFLCFINVRVQYELWLSDLFFTVLSRNFVKWVQSRSSLVGTVIRLSAGRPDVWGSTSDRDTDLCLNRFVQTVSGIHLPHVQRASGLSFVIQQLRRESEVLLRSVSTLRMCGDIHQHPYTLQSLSTNKFTHYTNIYFALSGFYMFRLVTILRELKPYSLKLTSIN